MFFELKFTLKFADMKIKLVTEIWKLGLNFEVSRPFSSLFWPSQIFGCIAVSCSWQSLVFPSLHIFNFIFLVILLQTSLINIFSSKKKYK